MPGVPRRPIWLPPLVRVNPVWWFPATAALIALDYVVGPAAPLPVFYAVPVILASWYSGRGAGLWLALMLPVERHVLEQWVWATSVPTDQGLLLTTMIRISTFTLLALLTFRLSEHERALARDLTVLQGLLPLCSICKSIKNASEQWESLETYLESRSSAEFSHGICPDCEQESLAYQHQGARARH